MPVPPRPAHAYDTVVPPAMPCRAERDPELWLSAGPAEPGQEALQGAGEGDHRGEGGAGEHGRGEQEQNRSDDAPRPVDR